MSEVEKQVQAIMDGLARGKDEEVRRFKQCIIEKLRHGFIYVRVKSHKEESELPAPNIDFGSKEQREAITRLEAYLKVAFNLTHVRMWCGKDKNDESTDKLILRALDDLAKAGKACILDIKQIHDARYELELHFECESGTGWSNFACVGRKSAVERLYVDKPLRKKERADGRGILDVLKTVELLQADTQRKLQLRYGKPVDLNIERQLDKEEYDAKVELGVAQIKLARALEKKDKRV